MLSLQLAVAAAGRTLLLSSQAASTPAPTLPVIADSKNLTLFLDAEYVSTTSDNRIFTDSSPNNFSIANTNRSLIQGGFHPYGSSSEWSLDCTLARLLLQNNSTSTFAFMHDSNAKFTFECWHFIRGTNDFIYIDNRAESDSQRGVTISTVANKLRLRIGNGTGVGPVCSLDTTSTLARGTWTHIAVTYDQSLASGNAKIYIDGNLNTTTNKTAQAPSTGFASYRLALFARPDAADATKSPRGFISNLRITNDIVYSAPFTPPTTGLTATSATQLLLFNGNSYKDYSQNSFSFTSENLSGTNPAFSLSRFNPFGAPLTTTSSAGSALFNPLTTNLLTLPADQAFVFGTDDFTIESWIYPYSAGGGSRVDGQGMIFGIYTASAATKSFAFSLATGNTVQFLDRTTSPNTYITSTTVLRTTSWPSPEWTHVAAVRNNGTLTIYINGLASVTATNTSNFSSSSQYIIGQNGIGTQRFDGFMSDLRVIKGVAAYTGNFTPPVEPLTAITGTSLLLKFNNGGLLDKTQIHRVASSNTATSRTAISSLVTKNGNSSLYFGGASSEYISASTEYEFLGLDFTVEFWINFQEFRSGPIVTNNTSFTSVSDNATGHGIFIFGNTSTNRINVSITNDSGSSSWNVTSGTAILAAAPELNTWYHFAITRRGNTFRTFSNGTQVSTFTSTAVVPEKSAIYIGGTGGSVANSNFKGYIDDFKIYLGQAKYTSNFTPT